MKQYFLAAMSFLLITASLFADDDVVRLLGETKKKNTDPAYVAKQLKLDPKRIINESNNFLKEREPEMSAEEYALYEKIVTMLSSKPDFALKLLEAMMNDNELPSPAFEFILGNAYYAAGQNDKAESRYLSAVKRFPTFLRAWNNLGILYYTTLNYSEATRCFSKSIVLGDRDPQTFGLLAYSLEQQQKIIPAEMAYMQALSGDPSNIDWLEGLLRIYVQGKQFGRAEWLVKDLIKQKPTENRYWLVYSTILLSQDRRLEALALLETCVAAGVAGTDELNVLADLYAQQKLIPEAIGAYRKILTTTPNLGEEKLLSFADSLIYNRNLDQAQEVLNTLKGKTTEAGQLRLLQAEAELLAARQQWPQARQQLQELLALSPMNGSALVSLGKTYMAEEDWAHALLTFEEAVQIPEATYRASLELATIELKNRHYDKTVEYLEKALAIEKTPAVQDFLARVKPLVNKSN